ncbi:type III-B CRISPR module-associated Cmr3 family protein [Candidatus Methanocrinis natronophilus]|uniref:Type III-B CRISPR module-associated Cmr3 family protein n=1 Tax=Candidatus Methanocrinis natronophilus TaxID=3033396 RepID=A0ABT5X4P2_9EURY|nr:type III-B CRISPR module-associated Cmr3 family protein [Candidatus Methanocrinis natronophilus]MDF0589658.1 type III-B CRISPR module-associated Cmr3 family protein [Candidatus Methanocrinis natronophilus]
MATYLTVTVRDPIIARDSRPFGTGQRMGSLDWLYPSVLAGSLRTILGNISQADFSKQETIDALKKVSIAGPLPFWDGMIFLPAPRDIIVKEEMEKEIIKRQAYAIRPTEIEDGEGCDLPFSKGVLRPAMLPIQEEFKPAGIPAFWSADKMVEWLESPDGKCFIAPPGPPNPEKEIKTGSQFLPNPQKDTRTHVKIDPKIGSAEDEMLFRTVGLDLSLKGQPHGMKISVKVDTDGVVLGDKQLGDLVANLDCFGTLGGERRLVHWKAEPPKKQIYSTRMRFQSSDKLWVGWNYSGSICNSLKKQNSERKRLRLILATPAIFYNTTDICHGWLPGWLKYDGSSIEGAPPEAPKDLKLKLISACVDRWKPISGWSLEKTKQGDKRGPKPIRRLVPAGSVYFFEVEGDAIDLVEKFWLKSICDIDGDRRDGFGLALWGVWEGFDNE